ncbi:MAG: hypothetical protein R2851_10450 [Caldilineaceae bacterium]
MDDVDEDVRFLDQTVRILRRGCGGDHARARELIAAHDGRVDAIGLDGLPARLQLGRTHVDHAQGATLAAAATQTPVVDGDGIRAGLERWGVILGDRAEPGIFSQKRVLMVPGLNHGALAQALERRGSDIRYADPFVYFGLPDIPGVGSRQTLDQAAPATLQRLKDEPFRRIFPSPVHRAAPALRIRFSGPTSSRATSARFVATPPTSWPTRPWSWSGRGPKMWTICVRAASLCW